MKFEQKENILQMYFTDREVLEALQEWVVRHGVFFLEEDVVYYDLREKGIYVKVDESTQII